MAGDMAVLRVGFNRFGNNVNRVTRLVEQGKLGEAQNLFKRVTPQIAGLNKVLRRELDQRLYKSISTLMPEMTNVSKKISVMSDELKVGLFQKVMKGYVIGEDNEPQYAYRLKAILNDPSQASNVLTFANFFDAGEFTKRLSHLSGRRFEIPTYEEWEAAKKSVGSQLSGNLWEWTRSVLMYGLSRSMEHNYLHSLIKAHSIHRDPLSRSSKYAVRLIEYI